MLNDTQKAILSNLRFFKDGARYSDLKLPELENDLFNYHLQYLVKEGYLQKNDQKYLLTDLGKSLVTNINEEDKYVASNYKISVYICLISKNKVLLYKRLKHPQYGYVGLPGGKMKYGENILQAASRELLEETGLTAKMKIVGNLHQIRKDSQGKIIEDGMFYVCYANKFSGQLKPDTQEGEFFWTDIKTVGKIDKLFRPSVELILKHIKNKKFGFIYELEPEPEDY